MPSHAIQRTATETELASLQPLLASRFVLRWLVRTRVSPSRRTSLGSRATFEAVDQREHYWSATYWCGSLSVPRASGGLDFRGFREQETPRHAPPRVRWQTVSCGSGRCSLAMHAPRPNLSINTDSRDKAAPAGYVKR